MYRGEPHRKRRILEATLESMDDLSAFSVDPDWRYLYFNRVHAASMKAAYGLDIAEGDSMLDCVPHDEDRGKIEACLKRALAGESLAFVDEYGDRKQYSSEVSFNPLRDEAGDIIGVGVFGRDVTDRRQSDLLARQHGSFVRTALENLPLVFYMIDPDGVFQLSIGAGLDRLGLEQNQVVGLSVFDVYKDNPTIIDAMNRSLNGEFTQIESEVEGVHHMNIAVPHRSADGGDDGVIGVALDISDLMEAEQARKDLEAQLMQAQRLESVGRLAGGVAHDFNNMLGVILGYAELIGERLAEDDPIAGDLHEIEHAARHSRDLTRQLLAFSRKQIISPEPLDLNEVVSGMQRTLSRMVGEDLEMSFLPHDGLWTIRFDRSQFTQILINLAVNARDAMPRGGRLTIATDNARLDEDDCRDHAELNPGSYACLIVSDDGIGMDRETLDHIFDPFFTTKDLGRGTGLGLATVYGIVKQNDGFIDVSSEPGRGTTFRIFLPRLDGGVAKPEKQETEAVLEGGGTILLVEDDDLVRGMSARIIRSLGYEVLVAGTAEEAISFCGDPDTAIDLLVTDVVMPGTNGPELDRKIRELKPGIATLFMSGYTSNVIVHHGVLDEGIHFLHKPFRRIDLAREIREALGGD